MDERRPGVEFHTPLGAPTLEQLTGLVFELASQLHQERMQRIALEAALEAAALLKPGAADRLSADPRVTERGGAALDKAIGGIMRVLTENSDQRAPMRPTKTIP